jgi:hypothetical protein
MCVALALAIQIVSERYTKPQSLLVRIRPYSYLFAVFAQPHCSTQSHPCSSADVRRCLRSRRYIGDTVWGCSLSSTPRLQQRTNHAFVTAPPPGHLAAWLLDQGYRLIARLESAEYARFQQAGEQERPDYFDGIGYMFLASDPYGGIAIDDCITDGQLSDFAQQHLPASYVEISPSGSGIKFIARASGDYGRQLLQLSLQ